MVKNGWGTLCAPSGSSFAFFRARAGGLARRGGTLFRALGARAFLRGSGALAGRALAGRLAGVFRKRLLRRGRMTFALQRLAAGARALGGSALRGRFLRGGFFRRRLLAALRLLRRLAFLRNVHAGAARLRQPDRDRLFGRTRAMLALTYVVDFLAHELASLGAGGFAFALVLLRTRDRFLVRHVAPPCPLCSSACARQLARCGPPRGFHHALAFRACHPGCNGEPVTVHVWERDVVACAAVKSPLACRVPPADCREYGRTRWPASRCATGTRTACRATTPCRDVWWRRRFRATGRTSCPSCRTPTPAAHRPPAPRARRDPP